MNKNAEISRETEAVSVRAVFLLQLHYSEASGHSGAPLTDGLMLCFTSRSRLSIKHSPVPNISKH